MDIHRAVPEMRFQTPRGERRTGPGHPAFIIAEMSANHQQQKEKAFRLIDAAAEAGVDAIKMQTYTADTMTIDCDNGYFQVNVNDAWKGQTLYRLYQSACTPWEWQAELKDYGEKKGLTVFSAPFDETAVDFLETLHVPLYKVASFETGDLELLKRIGRTKKPVIISRGMTSVDELTLALQTLRDAGTNQVAILHCVSGYPASIEQMNLTTIPDIASRFEVVVGLSDHTLGTTAAIVSVALGAGIIEKHLTLSRGDGGPDAAFSLEPSEMRHLVDQVREAEKSIGRPTYEPVEGEKENLTFRRSIFVIKDIKKGERLSRENIRSIRPGQGLPPKYFAAILGKVVVCDLLKGTPLQWEDLEDRSAMQAPATVRQEQTHPECVLRQAETADAEAVYEIRNDPTARASSRTQETILLEDHLRWFEKHYFSGSGHLCYVLTLEQRVIGYCRFDRRSTGGFNLSIAIAPSCRGRGMGRFLLKESLARITTQEEIYAEVFTFNQASRALFEKCAFVLDQESDGVLFFRRPAISL